MEKCSNKLTEVNQLLVRLHLHKNEEDLCLHKNEDVVFVTRVDGSYSLTVAMETSVWGVVVLFYGNLNN